MSFDHERRKSQAVIRQLRGEDIATMATASIRATRSGRLLATT